MEGITESIEKESIQKATIFSYFLNNYFTYGENSFLSQIAIVKAIQLYFIGLPH